MKKHTYQLKKPVKAVLWLVTILLLTGFVFTADRGYLVTSALFALFATLSIDFEFTTYHELTSR